MKSLQFGNCELCGTHAELRPYGPNNENICFECGMKDQETTKEKFLEHLEKTMEINQAFIESTFSTKH